MSTLTNNRLSEERVAVYQWIKDDCGAAIQMTITPVLIDKLLARLNAARSQGRSEVVNHHVKRIEPYL